MRDDLESLPFPALVVAGNMDTGNKHTQVPGPMSSRNDPDLNVTSAQLRRFSSHFGELNWSFIHKGVRFIGICSMVAGSSLPEEEELWRWIDRLDEAPVEHTVWVMHYPLFIDRPDEPDFDITDPDHYRDWYFGIDRGPRSRLMKAIESTGANLVLSGHVHCRKTHHTGGIRFDIAPSTAFPQWGDRWDDGDPALGFIVYEVQDQAITPEFVPLREISDAEGYGPGGHPSPDKRDYSRAWAGDP